MNVVIIRDHRIEWEIQFTFFAVPLSVRIIIHFNFSIDIVHGNVQAFFNKEDSARISLS